MAEHNELGKKGEKLAIDFLLKNGYKILETNYRFLKAEVDIIAQKEEVLAVVEVKTRSHEEFGSPLDAISNNKIKLIIGAAEAYIMQEEIDLETRFDVIAVIGNNEAQIEHIEDAFYPEL